MVGAGGLSEPRLPDIDGIEEFQGALFHSARWDHDVDLTGKRVAVIGTGASAIQIVPEIQERVGHLDVYQRTAPYVLPRNDRRYGRLERLALRHVPGLQKLYRTAIYWGRETYVPGFTLQPKLALPAKKMALANLAKGVSDPALREKLTPTFEIGCKRILISNTYYPALASDNVEVVTDRIAKVTGERRRHRGRRRAADRRADRGDRLLHHRAADHRAHHRPRGPDARGPVARERDGGVQGHHRARLPQPVHAGRPQHRPGPLQHGLHHRVAGRLPPRRDPHDGPAPVRRRRARRRPRTDAWNADLQRRMERTVWSTGGCSSWYLDDHGRNTTLWPRSTFTFRTLLARFDVGGVRRGRTPARRPPTSDPSQTEDVTA